jgi:hypothetical protein
MRLDRAVGHEKPERPASGEAPQREIKEGELENRITNLDKLTEALSSALGQESFPNQFEAIGLVSDLRLKAKATQHMFEVGRLLDEPARSEVLSNVVVSLMELETVIALKFGVELK